MDFEIEGDDDYDFEDDWKKGKAKKSFFGGDSSTGGGEDDYNYDFGDVSSKIDSKKDKYSNVRSSYAPTSSQPASKLKDVSNVSKSMSAIDKTGDNALANAQNMLSKYSAKPAVKKKPASSMFDFDEDDISVDSDMSASPVKKPKPRGQAADAPSLSSFGNNNNKKKPANRSMDSMNSLDSGLEESDSAMDIGGGLDSGPPMFGDSEPPPPAKGGYQNKSKGVSAPASSANAGASTAAPNQLERQNSAASMNNDYADVIGHDEPSPYKMPRGGNYNSNPINNFSVDDEDEDDVSYRLVTIT
jgi:hypothetical protein